MPYWNFATHRRDLEEKLEEFQDYYNAHGVHQALKLNTPEEAAGKDSPPPAKLRNFEWQSHSNGLFQIPIAA